MTEVRLSEKVKDVFDPTRCQAQVLNGDPCMFRAEPNQRFCKKHAGRGEMAKRHQRIMRYRLQQEKMRQAEDLADGEALSLRDEIIVLRITLQDVLTHADSQPNGFVLNADMISNLSRQVGSLVEKCFKLEQFGDEHLTRTQVMELSNTLINIVAMFVTEEQLQQVIEKFAEAIQSVGRNEDDNLNEEAIL